ncbi:MAG: hypothetical protein U5K31_10625 [Balneolaceae bacterium]|nr:hypothetical protein [Balneolaceae bacterium]
MRNILSILIFLIAFPAGAHAQQANVEKTLYGVQAGFLGIWGHNEYRLSNAIALRSEVGLDTELFGGSIYDRTGYVFTPVLSLEPRWYYNLTNRLRKSRTIANNSGNFLSVKTSYHPSWFVISNYDNIRIVSDISIIPTWSIRRSIGRHFNFEAGLGIGYRYIFAKQAGYAENDSELAVNLNLRIGFHF